MTDLTTVNLAWKLCYDGHVWTAADVTGEEIGLLALMLGDNWRALDPLSSPIALMHHIAAHMAAHTGEDHSLWLTKMQAAQLPDLLAAIVAKD